MAKKFKGTLEEGFLSFVETNGQDTFGYVNITSRDKKVAKVYVRYGTIIAIENSNYRTNIFQRVISLEGMNDRSVGLLSQRFKDDEGNIAIVEAALDQQMAAGSELSKIIKENFIDSFYDLWSWGQVTLEWVANKEPQVPTVPAIQPSDLVKKAELIRDKIADDISPMLQVEADRILSLIPQIGDNEDYSKLRANEMTILQYSNGEHTLEDIIHGTGISLSGSQFAAARLWLSRHLFLQDSDGQLIAFEEERPEPETQEETLTVEESQQVDEPEQVLSDESETFENAVPAESSESFVEDEPAEIATPEQPDAEEEHKDDDTDSALNSFFDDSVPTPPVEEPAQPVRLEHRPRKLTFEEALAMTEEEQSVEEVFEEEPAVVAEEFPDETLPEAGEASTVRTAGFSANVRLTEIVEQLKSLMSEAQASLQESDKALHDKKEELEELYGKKRELNSEIMRSEEEYAALIENKQTLYNEYKNIIQQIKGMEGTL